MLVGLLYCLPETIRGQSKYMMLIDIFNDSQMKFKKQDNCSGHDPEHLIPTINQFNKYSKEGHKLRYENKTYSWVSYIAGVTLDFIEIPKVYGTYGLGSYQFCSVCHFVCQEFIGPTIYPFKNNGEVIQSDIIHSKSYDHCIKQIENNKSGSIKRPSVWITELNSFFPTQILKVDMCHTVAIGLIKWYIDSLKSIYGCSRNSPYSWLKIIL